MVALSSFVQLPLFLVDNLCSLREREREREIGLDLGFIQRI